MAAAGVTMEQLHALQAARGASPAGFGQHNGLANGRNQAADDQTRLFLQQRAVAAAAATAAALQQGNNMQNMQMNRDAMAALQQAAQVAAGNQAQQPGAALKQQQPFQQGTHGLANIQAHHLQAALHAHQQQQQMQQASTAATAAAAQHRLPPQGPLAPQGPLPQGLQNQASLANMTNAMYLLQNPHLLQQQHQQQQAAQVQQQQQQQQANPNAFNMHAAAQAARGAAAGNNNNIFQLQQAAAELNRGNNDRAANLNWPAGLQGATPAAVAAQQQAHNLAIAQQNLAAAQQNPAMLAAALQRHAAVNLQARNNMAAAAAAAAAPNNQLQQLQLLRQLQQRIAQQQGATVAAATAQHQQAQAAAAQAQAAAAAQGQQKPTNAQLIALRQALARNAAGRAALNAANVLQGAPPPGQQQVQQPGAPQVNGMNTQQQMTLQAAAAQLLQQRNAANLANLQANLANAARVNQNNGNAHAALQQQQHQLRLALQAQQQQAQQQQQQQHAQEQQQLYNNNQAQAAMLLNMQAKQMQMPPQQQHFNADVNMQGKPNAVGNNNNNNLMNGNGAKSPSSPPGPADTGGVMSNKEQRRLALACVALQLARGGMTVEQAINSGIMGGMSVTDVKFIVECYNAERLRMKDEGGGGGGAAAVAAAAGNVAPTGPPGVAGNGNVGPALGAGGTGHMLADGPPPPGVVGPHLPMSDMPASLAIVTAAAAAAANSHLPGGPSNMRASYDRSPSASIGSPPPDGLVGPNGTLQSPHDSVGSPNKYRQSFDGRSSASGQGMAPLYNFGVAGIAGVNPSGSGFPGNNLLPQLSTGQRRTSLESSVHGSVGSGDFPGVLQQQQQQSMHTMQAQAQHPLQMQHMMQQHALQMQAAMQQQQRPGSAMQVQRSGSPANSQIGDGGGSGEAPPPTGKPGHFDAFAYDFFGGELPPADAGELLGELESGSELEKSSTAAGLIDVGDFGLADEAELEAFKLAAAASGGIDASPADNGAAEPGAAGSPSGGSAVTGSPAASYAGADVTTVADNGDILANSGLTAEQQSLLERQAAALLGASAGGAAGLTELEALQLFAMGPEAAWLQAAAMANKARWEGAADEPISNDDLDSRFANLDLGSGFF